MKLRILAALGVLVSAVVHLRLWFDGVRDVHLIGPAFLLNGVAGIVIAVLLVAWRHWVPLLLAVGFGLSTLGAYVISATVGLFGVHEVWIGGAVLTAAASEIVAVVAGGAAFLREYPMGSRGESQHRFAVSRSHLD